MWLPKKRKEKKYTNILNKIGKIMFPKKMGIDTYIISTLKSISCLMEKHRLLPCPSYYKQCCDEHWGTCVSLNSGFLGVYAQQWDC